ncbi:Eco57I restriction-modification methylase domain-containing protein [Catellatospora sp. NPDC049133]|uniref:Eco57I restriction-modification methylase domain-containing protein n=1 Tax=Catellatospora sp. NPDC049133 TaxID=3155499 RepID=UPI0033C2AF2B
MPQAVRDWLANAPAPSDELIDELQADLAGDEDPLALLYERIVSGPRRRKLGTFFTPKPVLDYMRSLVRTLPRPPRSVADPGAGVGAFTVASRSWWPDADVHAVDVNLVTLGLLATRPESASAAGLQNGSGQLCVRHEDFIEWLETTWPGLAAPRLILGNPPYVRHQKMSASSKTKLQAACGILAPGGRAGLSTYFLAAALAVIEDDDSLCLLLPANWLEADYARSVRKDLWMRTQRRVDLHLFPNELNVFPGAQVPAMVIFVGPETTTRRPLRIFQVVGDIEHGFTSSSVFEDQRRGAAPRSFSPEQLQAGAAPAGSASVNSVPLSQIAVVRRGVATGANSFFLRTKSEVDELPPHVCVPAISRLRHLEGDVLDKSSHQKLGIDGAKCWLLQLTDEDEKDASVRALIKAGEDEMLHERFLCKVRSPWFAVERIPAPEILVGPMGKEEFRIVVNEIGAIPTNTLYGLRFRYRDGRAFPEGARVLADWLRSADGQESLRVAARKFHGDGLVKIEPRALAQVMVPAQIAAAISPPVPTCNHITR